MRGLWVKMPWASARVFGGVREAQGRTSTHHHHAFKSLSRLERDGRTHQYALRDEPVAFFSTAGGLK